MASDKDKDEESESAKRRMKYLSQGPFFNPDAKGPPRPSGKPKPAETPKKKEPEPSKQAKAPVPKTPAAASRATTREPASPPAEEPETPKKKIDIAELLQKPEAVYVIGTAVLLILILALVTTLSNWGKSKAPVAPEPQERMTEQSAAPEVFDSEPSAPEIIEQSAPPEPTPQLVPDEPDNATSEDSYALDTLPEPTPEPAVEQPQASTEPESAPEFQPEPEPESEPTPEPSPPVIMAPKPTPPAEVSRVLDFEGTGGEGDRWEVVSGTANVSREQAQSGSQSLKINGTITTSPNRAATDGKWVDLRVYSDPVTEVPKVASDTLVGITFDPRGRVFVTDGSAWADSGARVQLNAWQRITAHLDYDRQTFDLYVNGAPAGTAYGFAARPQAESIRAVTIRSGNGYIDDLQIAPTSPLDNE